MNKKNDYKLSTEKTIYLVCGIMAFFACLIGSMSSSSDSYPRTHSTGSYGSSYGSVSSSYGSSYGGSYDYDKGYGYSEPYAGESLSDYIKRQDPELYQSLQDTYNSATQE